MTLEECSGCGRCLEETLPGPDGRWEVEDGQPLGCGCAGAWSADGEGAWPRHDDEECTVCRDDDIETLRARVATMETERDSATGERDGATDMARHWREKAATLETARDAALVRLRCEVSGNPCNTDCRMVGRPPCCETCRWQRAASQKGATDGD